LRYYHAAVSSGRLTQALGLAGETQRARVGGRLHVRTGFSEFSAARKSATKASRNRAHATASGAHEHRGGRCQRCCVRSVTRRPAIPGAQLQGDPSHMAGSKRTHAQRLLGHRGLTSRSSGRRSVGRSVSCYLASGATYL